MLERLERGLGVMVVVRVQDAEYQDQGSVAASGLRVWFVCGSIALV